MKSTSRSRVIAATPGRREPRAVLLARAATPWWCRSRAALVAVSLAGAAAMGMVTACGVDLRDHICMSDEYPVQGVGPQGGSQCVPKGQDPPEGTVRYPKGQAPQRVDDKWDRYWQDHGLDARGQLITK